MFIRSFASKDRASKATKPPKRSFASKQKLFERLDSQQRERSKPSHSGSIITVVVGNDQRLFAAHEDVLCRSPYFARAVRDLFFKGEAKRIDLTDEEPETFSCVLEYLYKNDYTPRLVQDTRRNTWYIDSPQDHRSPKGGVDATMYHSRIGDVVLRDTCVYIAAVRFELPDLKRLALRKQGLQSGIAVACILRSARFAYDNTDDNESGLRAHYLALIIRSRNTFKRSGTMQQEMEMGGKLWWDLFVAMCNHMDDLQSVTNTPKTV